MTAPFDILLDSASNDVELDPTSGDIVLTSNASSCSCCNVSNCSSSSVTCYKVYITIPAINYHSYFWNTIAGLPNNFTFSGRTYEVTINSTTSGSDVSWSGASTGASNGNCSSPSPATYQVAATGSGNLHGAPCFALTQLRVSDYYDNGGQIEGEEPGDCESWEFDVYNPVTVEGNEPVPGTYSVAGWYVVSSPAPNGGLDTYNGNVANYSAGIIWPVPLTITIAAC